MKTEEPNGNVAVRKNKPPVPESIYSDALANEICDRIAAGETLAEISIDPNTPGYSTVLHWLADEKKGYLRKAYARARELQADHEADDHKRIERLVESGVIRADAGRVILGAKEWRAKVLNPKRYGDHQSIELHATVEASRADILRQREERRRDDGVTIEAQPLALESGDPLD